MLVAKGMDAAAASRAAMSLLGRVVIGQSTVIAFDTAFNAVALLFRHRRAVAGHHQDRPAPICEVARCAVVRDSCVATPATKSNTRPRRSASGVRLSLRRPTTSNDLPTAGSSACEPVPPPRRLHEHPAGPWQRSRGPPSTPLQVSRIDHARGIPPTGEGRTSVPERLQEASDLPPGGWRRALVAGCLVASLLLAPPSKPTSSILSSSMKRREF